MTESATTPSTKEHLASLRRGQHVDVERNGSPPIRGIIDVDVHVGVLWMREQLDERRMINTSEVRARPHFP